MIKLEDYSKVKRTIAILIADFDLNRLKNIKKYHTSWHIKEDKFSEIILTEKLEIHIIELKKLEVNNNHNVKYKKLTKWISFISNPNEKEVHGMEEDEDIKAARKVLEEISQDEKEREKAYYREKYIRDWNARVNEGFEQGVRQGREVGIEEGKEEEIKQGIEQGIEQEKIKICYSKKE